jgi:hypothetical protein
MGAEYGRSVSGAVMGWPRVHILAGLQRARAERAPSPMSALHDSGVGDLFLSVRDSRGPESSGYQRDSAGLNSGIVRLDDVSRPCVGGVGPVS